MSVMANKKEFIKSMPQGIVPLFFIQIVSTLSFSVLYSTLVLYMKGKLGLQISTANSIMGVFIAFNYGLHLLGGFWGGRLLSNRALFCAGMVAQIIGCILLSFGEISFLYYGLAAFLTGSGLNVTCLNCMLTQRFAPEDTRRETAFLMNYAGMNIGFFVGFSLSGVFQLTQNYERLFLLSSLGNLIALIICLYCWHQLSDAETIFSKKDKLSQKRAVLLGVILIIILPFMLSGMLQYADWAKKLVLVTGVLMLGVILYLAKQQPAKEARDKMVAFAVLMIVGTVFWMLYQIAPMGLTVFIDHNVQREYASWIIPPQWFQNINTVAIVIGGPLLGVLLHKMRGNGVQINIPTQFALALLFIGIAFAILPIGIAYANYEGLVSPSWIITSYILQSIGELLISPIGYAMIGYLAPSSLQGVMMGMWMLNSGVGATLSSYSSNLMIEGQDSVSPLVTNSGYSHVFLMLGLFAIGSSIVLFILVPKLRELIQEKKLTELQEPQSMSTNRVVVCE
ncbi:peptide transport protein [Legionella steigerwaltii]|uniref:Peptide transport protein n=1 Tax=Legionella steigerwaltii TaxID=460 RepID=A0A378LB72_9GAMM|nr:oligopeptide:H+ symporter [Legionella steigerwaltii]KTD80106.1 peptide transport protein [Legionella steigerwaltii]STY23128.1 peptide transport protein [Legionella steigerwaltii]